MYRDVEEIYFINYHIHIKKIKKIIKFASIRFRCIVPRFPKLPFPSKAIIRTTK